MGSDGLKSWHSPLGGCWLFSFAGKWGITWSFCCKLVGACWRWLIGGGMNLLRGEVQFLAPCSGCEGNPLRKAIRARTPVAYGIYECGNNVDSIRQSRPLPLFAFLRSVLSQHMCWSSARMRKCLLLVVYCL